MALPMYDSSDGNMIPTLTLRLRLIVARINAGLDQSDLARALRCGERTIRRYEKGETTPDYPALNLWAQACRVPLEWLETGRDGAGDGIRSRWTQGPALTTPPLRVVATLIGS